MIDVFIPGNPAPQGSKRHVGGGVMIESSKKVKPWRESIRSALIDDKGKPIGRIEGPVVTVLEFVMPRPGYLHAPSYIKGKKRTPPMDKRPDLDKAERAANDAMKSAGVYRDDSCINLTFKGKRYAEIGEASGLRIQLFAFDQDAWAILDAAMSRLVEIEGTRVFKEAA